VRQERERESFLRGAFRIESEGGISRGYDRANISITTIDILFAPADTAVGWRSIGAEG